MTGTSSAAAHVSGIAALVLAADPAISREELVALLARTARDLGATGTETEYGAGLVNARRAVEPSSATAPAADGLHAETAR